MDVMVYIEYKDSKGGISERVITILDAHTTAKASIMTAHCHERNGMRTFKLGSTMLIADTDTGEIFDNEEFFKELTE